jgi:hypothetical protein
VFAHTTNNLVSTRAGHCSLYEAYIWRRIMDPVTILSTWWEGQVYGRFCTVRVQVSKILYVFDGFESNRSLTY